MSVCPDPIAGTDIRNPFLDMLGVSVVRWDAEQVELALPVVPALMNRVGRIQGGVLATVLDAAAGYAGIYTPPGATTAHSVTLALTTNFLDTGTGTKLRATGTVRRRGRSIFFAESEVWLDDHTLLATATGTFKYLQVGPART